MIRSDQRSLKELLQQIIQTPDQQFYVRKLMGYKFRIEYKTGASNRVADALSRRDMEPDKTVAELEQADTALLSMVAHLVADIFEVLLAETESLVELRELKSLIEKGEAGGHLTFVGGLIYHGRRIYVGEGSAAKLPLINEHHSTPQAGHPGVDRTFRRLAA